MILDKGFQFKLILNSNLNVWYYPKCCGTEAFLIYTFLNRAPRLLQTPSKVQRKMKFLPKRRNALLPLCKSWRISWERYRETVKQDIQKYKDASYEYYRSIHSIVPFIHYCSAFFRLYSGECMSMLCSQVYFWGSVSMQVLLIEELQCSHCLF